MRRTFQLTIVLLSTFAAGGVTSSGAQTFLTFHCADGTEFVTAFYRGRRSAYVQLDGKAMTLPPRISLSGARYSAGDITLRIKGNSATLTRGRHLSRGRRSTDCSSS
jgi:membrane-bound inhibitor of C-type lysozyme